MVRRNEILIGNCLWRMWEMEAESVNSIVTDPPYGLKFMGKDWDHGVPGEPFWREALRVAKPGAHLLAFGGSRTVHRLACAIEDAGWEIRDRLYWAYGNGFPKNHDVSKAIDKTKGAEREMVGDKLNMPGYYLSGHRDTGRYGHGLGGSTPKTRLRAAITTAPATPEAKQWEGWGTALKPAVEPIVLARKPLEKGLTVAENVLKYGTGALNIDGGRIEGEPWKPRFGNGLAKNKFFTDGDRSKYYKQPHSKGRWPANLMHDGSAEVLDLFPETGKSTGGTGIASQYPERDGTTAGNWLTGACAHMGGLGDSGSAARFFYCAKASSSERGAANKHPTVKPLKLMRYLVRLVTPPGGLVLDPFAGSGSTLVAAAQEGFDYLGIEREAEYAETAQERLSQLSCFFT